MFRYLFGYHGRRVAIHGACRTVFQFRLPRRSCRAAVVGKGERARKPRRCRGTAESPRGWRERSSIADLHEMMSTRGADTIGLRPRRLCRRMQCGLNEIGVSRCHSCVIGRGGNRTRTSLRTRDFKSPAYTNFATRPVVSSVHRPDRGVSGSASSPPVQTQRSIFHA